MDDHVAVMEVGEAGIRRTFLMVPSDQAAFVYRRTPPTGSSRGAWAFNPCLHGFLVLTVCLLACMLLGPGIVLADAGQPAKIMATCKAGEGRMEVIRGWLLSEPSFQGIVIPSRTFGEFSSEDVWKMIRIYFPRTYEALTEYGFILLASVDMQFFTDKQAQWMYEAIAKDGLGGMNTRSVMSMSVAWSGPWMNSILSDAFPNDVVAVVNHEDYRGENFAVGPIVVNDDRSVPPVVGPFKNQIEAMYKAYQGVMTVPRPGSTIYTWIRSGLMQQRNPLAGYVPHLFSWRYENATTFTAMDMVCEDFWKGDRNPHSLDVIVNVVWHSTNRDLPEDAIRVHALRDLFRQFQLRKSVLVSVFEFAEDFGASTVDVYSRLGGIEEKKAGADQEYLGGDFEASYDRMVSLSEDLRGLEDRAVKLKNSALAWVYLIEWLTVSGTMLICGVVIRELMVKRSMYREVTVTRHR